MPRHAVRAANLAAHETLVVLLGFESGRPFPVRALHVHSEMLQHGTREGERRIVVAKPAEHGHGDCEEVGVAVEVLAVEIRIDDEPESVDEGRLVEGFLWGQSPVFVFSLWGQSPRVKTV